MIRADVAVVGGGLAARWMAARLATSAQVVRVAPSRPSPGPATAAALGIVAAGGHDSPLRLAQAVGAETARDLWRFSRAATARLLALDPAPERGVWRIALSDAEHEEWRRSVEFLRAWGDAADVVAATGEELAAAGVGTGFAGGHRFGLDGCVALDRLTLDESAVAVVDASASIDRVDGDGVLLGGEVSVLAEVAVVAAGIGSRAVHPFFESLLYPVQLQARRSGAGSGAGAACVARHRYEAWRPRSGGIDFLGCRWAEQPEMGAGVEDDRALSDAVAAKQDAFVVDHELAGAATERWAGIAGYSCDGLPLLGPLPGIARVHALTGWCGWGLSWIGEAVEAVAGSILGEPSDAALPTLLQARRML